MAVGIMAEPAIMKFLGTLNFRYRSVPVLCISVPIPLPFFASISVPIPVPVNVFNVFPLTAISVTVNGNNTAQQGFAVG